MKWYKIMYDCGCGEMVHFDKCKDEGAAKLLAYNCWKDAAESQAEYTGTELTREHVIEERLAPEDYGFEPEAEHE